MKVLNFGSLNIDYVYNVDHFVKKGETISSNMLNVFGGGKGLNQSIALSKAGAAVYHAGAIGTDGIFLEELLTETGVDTRFLKKYEKIRSGNAIIQNDAQGDNCIILYGGANQAITRKMVDEVIQEFEEGDWLVLQNEICEIPYIVEKAHERNLKIMLNPSPMNDKIFDINLEYIDCFIMNEVEAETIIRKQGDKNFLLECLRERFPHAEIVLTLGEKGSVYLGKQGKVEQKAYKVKTVDTTAAGDTFTGYYLAGRLEGLSIEETLKRASKASAIAVSKKGAAPSIPEKIEVLKFESNTEN